MTTVISTPNAFAIEVLDGDGYRIADIKKDRAEASKIATDLMDECKCHLATIIPLYNFDWGDLGPFI